MKINRIYGHQELAMLYFPNVLPDSASTQLSRWINKDEELLADLRKAGYRKGARLFTPLQVSILQNHLGDPETWQMR